MPKGKRPVISDEDVKTLLMMRDEEGFTFEFIGKLLGYERSTVANTYHRVKKTPTYWKTVERNERARAAKERSGSQPLAKIYEQEFKHADIRRLWKVLQATSRIERGEYAA